MATGGGTPAPSHGSSLSLSSSLLANSTSSKSDSLQTPDSSTLFISSLSNIDASAPPLPTVVPDFCSSPQSFTSLEELLNVTGINSPGLGDGSGPAGGGGVYSLQQLAKEVDNEQQGSFDLQPPPKKLHLDPSVSLSQPQIQQQQLPGNIRVQPLRSVSPLPDKPTTSEAPLQNNKLPLSVVPSMKSNPLSLQLSNSQTSTISNTVSSAPVYSQYSTYQPSVGLRSHSSTLPLVASSATTSALVGNGTSPSFTVLPHPPQTQFQSNPLSIANTLSVRSTQHQHMSLHSESAPPFQSTQGLSPIINPTTLPPPISFSMATSTSSQSVTNVPSLASTLPNRMQAPSAITSAPPVSSQNTLLQLIMLYKNCQMMGDEQGMARLKQQFIQQAARTQILTQQATKHLSQTTQPSSRNPNQASSSGSTPFQSSLRTSGVSSTQSHPDVKSNVTNNHLLRVPTPPVATTTSISPQQQQISSVNLSQLFVSSQQQAQLPSMPRTVNSGAPSSTHSTGPWNSPANNPPPSVLGQGSSASINPMSSVQRSSPVTLQEQANVATATQQRVIKQLQNLMATLPETHRPKNVTELRDFIQKYGSILSAGNKIGPQPGKQTPPTNLTDFSNSSTSSSTLFADNNTRSQAAVPSLLGSAKSESTHNNTQQSSTAIVSGTAVPLPHSNTSRTNDLPSVTNSTPFDGTASAQVAEHFKTSLLGIQPPPPRSAIASVLPTFSSSSSQMSSVPFPSNMPIVISDSPPVDGETPPISLLRTNISQPSLGSLQTTPIAAPMTVHAPVTSQFQQPSSTVQTNKMPTNKAPSNPQGIQPGVPTPLPPGLTLETLGVLCRLPESELVKLKIPAALLSAIRVWKARQMPLNKSGAKQPSANTTRNNIPVLTAPSNDVTAAGGSSSIVTFGANGNVFGQNLKVGDALKASSSLRSSSAMKTDTGNKTIIGHQQQQQQQPLVIPGNAGFPPRSLHAYIPMIPQAQQQLRNTANSSTGTRNANQPMTRFRSKLEQQKADSDRIQALTRALQSSEEARIAFRFSAHLEKMHSQLLSPDTLTPFRSHHDVLARLLPYHIYAEPEPPPAAVEKADAVFESVAQVLLSRSRGLMSRFQQITTKTEAQGGPELMCMQMQLERLFQQGEQERIRQENVEKQQAEQVAADLSLMADGMDSFDADFSLGDAFYPVLEMDAGIT